MQFSYFSKVILPCMAIIHRNQGSKNCCCNENVKHPSQRECTDDEDTLIYNTLQDFTKAIDFKILWPEIDTFTTLYQTPPPNKKFTFSFCPSGHLAKFPKWQQLFVMVGQKYYWRELHFLQCGMTHYQSEIHINTITRLLISSPIISLRYPAIASKTVNVSICGPTYFYTNQIQQKMSMNIAHSTI